LDASAYSRTNWILVSDRRIDHIQIFTLMNSGCMD